MWFMTLIKILLFVAANLPEIIKIVKAIMDFIRQIQDKDVAKAATGEFSAAINAYARYRDIRPLESLLKKLRCDVAGKCDT